MTGPRRNRWEYRKVPYRPEKPNQGKKGDLSLIIRFTEKYLWPHKWPIFLCIILMSFTACFGYIQSFYTKIAVDNILMVGDVPAVIRDMKSQNSAISQARAADLKSSRPAETEYDGTRQKTKPEEGFVSEKYRSASDTRPPWAGRKLTLLCIIYLVTLLFFNIATRIIQRVLATVSQKITEKLRDEMHDKIMSMSMSYHTSNSPGRLMARIISDVDVVKTQLLDLIVNASSQIIMFLVGIISVFILNPLIGVVLLTAMIPFVILALKIRPQIRKVSMESRHTNSSLWNYVSQKLDGAKAIIAYGREKTELLFMHRLSACLLRDVIRQQKLSATLTRMIQLISQFTDRGTFIYCTYLVLSGTMTLGTMLYINSAICNLFIPAVVLTQLTVQLSVLLVVLQRVTLTLDARQEVAEDPDAIDFPSPVRDKISVKNVSFAWDSSHEPVLKDISFDIRVGDWLCIMGSSGCGKSTLLQLIARLYDPQQGSIEVDGVNLEKIKFTSLRRNMAFVPQEAQIFGGTIRDNIAYGYPDATPAMIMEAAKSADAHDFIMELPVKYETVTGEKGATLSGGQRQRISIARALITRPEILLLDDCTSALDANTERKLQNTFEQILQNRTAIIVSQRVSMAMRCRKIIVLREGRIIEQGSHDELLAQNGYYADIYRTQTDSAATASVI